MGAGIRSAKEHDMTPYTTPRTTTGGGVQIGLLYQPRLPAIEGHALRIQAALLDKRTATPLTGLKQMFGFFWRML